MMDVSVLFDDYFSSNDRIIVDTNVLIYVYCPINSEAKEGIVSHYSMMLNKIQTSGASVFINSLIVSEFFNVWAKLDFKRSGLKDYKNEYRASDRFKTLQKRIFKELDKFFKSFNVTKIDDNFSGMNLTTMYQAFPASDFNDLVIVNNAIFYKCKILTEDGDFDKYNIPVIH